jgi:hypothetical protein
VLLFELEAYCVVPRVCEVGESFGQIQHEEDDGIISDGDAELALFNFDQRRPACGRARSGDLCRDTPAPARILIALWGPS